MNESSLEEFERMTEEERLLRSRIVDAAKWYVKALDDDARYDNCTSHCNLHTMECFLKELVDDLRKLESK